MRLRPSATISGPWGPSNRRRSRYSDFCFSASSSGASSSSSRCDASMLVRADVEMRRVRPLLQLLGLDAEAREKLPVLLHVRVAGSQELLPVEDGVGAGEEGQGLHLV